jgi:hypothetical protein
MEGCSGILKSINDTGFNGEWFQLKSPGHFPFVPQFRLGKQQVPLREAASVPNRLESPFHLLFFFFAQAALISSVLLVILVRIYLAS